MPGQWDRGQTTAARGSQEQTIRETHRQAKLPAVSSSNLTHGYVTEVNQDVRQVKVKSLSTDQGIIADGAWLPVDHDELEIQKRWGQLREGMFCRVFWTGMGKARRVLYVEILSTEIMTVKKQPQVNELDFNPYKFLSGKMEL